MQEIDIPLATGVTLIVHPRHGAYAHRRISEGSALTFLRPVGSNAILMGRLRSVLPAEEVRGLTDDQVLTQIARAVAHRHGMILAIQPPLPKMPDSENERLLTHLIFSEATQTGGGMENEMAAVAYSAINRQKYLQSHPKVRPSFFRAKDRTLRGVIEAPGQYGSVNGRLWKQVDTPRKLTPDQIKILEKSISVAVGALAGRVPDPWASEGGTYGMRTRGHSPIAGAFFDFANQIDGSGNVFYGLNQQ